MLFCIFSQNSYKSMIDGRSTVSYLATVICKVLESSSLMSKNTIFMMFEYKFYMGHGDKCFAEI